MELCQCVKTCQNDCHFLGNIPATGVDYLYSHQLLVSKYGSELQTTFADTFLPLLCVIVQQIINPSDIKAGTFQGEPGLWIRHLLY